MPSRSSYDTLFCKPALRWLFQDYLSEGLQSVMRFAPPEDPKVSVNFRFGASLRELGRNSAGEARLESMTALLLLHAAQLLSCCVHLQGPWHCDTSLMQLIPFPLLMSKQLPG